MKLERILTSIALVLISGLVAVSTSFAQTVSYKGSPMRSGEIVVVQRGDAILQQKANVALDAVRADFSPSLGREVNAETRVWEVAQGDMDAVLARLNAIEGVTAFPNYVYKREEMTPTMVDEQLLAQGASVPVDRPLRPMPSFPSQRRAVPSQPVRPSIQMPKPNVDRTSVDLGVIATGGDTLFTEDFNDSQQVEDRWYSWEAGESQMGWGLVYPYQDSSDGAMGIGDFDNGYDNNVWSSIDVPLNTSGLSGRLAYDISFNFMVETEDDWDYMYFVIWDPVAERVIHSSSFTGSSNGLQTHTRSISGIGQVDEVIMAFQFESDSEVTIGFGAFIDDIVITSRASDTPTDFFFPAQWSFENDGTFSDFAVEDADIDMLSAWTVTEGTDDVVVVIMDDGVDFDHPDLAPNAWVNPGEDLNSDGVITPDEQNGIDDDGNGYVDDFHGWYTNYDTNEYLTSGSFHGTHVAGTVGAASYNGIGVAGVAPGVKLASVMFFDEYGNADAASILGAYSYITALLEQGVNVVAINQSWGGGDYYYGDPNQAYMVQEMTMHAFDHADHGALWVVSAGNSSVDRDNLYFYSYPNNIPAPNIITVASSTDADELSDFSDFGVRTVDIAAPGSDIISTYPDGRYAYLSGTSMAAPHVSGVVALAASAFPDEPMEGRLARILATGDEISSFIGVFGEGERLNAAMALNAESTLQGLVASHASALTQYTVDDLGGATAIGFVNASGASLEVTGWSIAQQGDAFELPLQPDAPISFGDGEAFGLPVFYAGTSIVAEEATVTINTTQGDVQIGVDAIKLGYGEMFMSNDYDYKGVVNMGDVVSSTFELTATGTVGLGFGLYPNLMYDDPAMTMAVRAATRGMERAPVVDKQGTPAPRPTDYYVGGYAARPGVEPIAVQYNDTTTTIYLEDFESYQSTEDVQSAWIIGTFQGVTTPNTWMLTTLTMPDESTNNVLATAAPGENYVPDMGTYAVMPPFDFSSIEIDGASQLPARIGFDYAGEMEPVWDGFFIDVYVEGWYERTIAVANSEGNLLIDGEGHYVELDLSWLAGAPYVEFVFGFYSDGGAEFGFGFLFDDVSISVQPSPITYRVNGTPADGGYVTLDGVTTVEVEYDSGFGVGGPVTLFTEVYSNGISGSDWLLHTMEMVIASDDVLLLDVPTVQVSEGETVDVPISLSNMIPANLNVYSFDMVVYYDPNVVTIDVLDQVPAEAGDGSDWLLIANEPYPGELLISAAGSTPLSQPGQLVNLTVNAMYTGFSDIFIDGYINASEMWFAMTAPAGIEVTPGGIMGDVDMNQMVQAYDASMVLQHVVGYEPVMNEYMADVDGSETIDATDASYILQYVVKLIDCMPVECAPGKGAASWGHAAVAYAAPRVSGDEVRIPVSLQQVQGAVGALTLDITGLGEHVSFLGIEEMPTTWMKAHRVSGDGMRLAIASGMSMAPGDGFTLVFKVAEGRSEELSFEAQINNGPVHAAAIELGELPGQVALHAIYPNPFSSQATVRFDLPEVAEVTVRVIDVLGREVARIADGVYEAGVHQMPIQLGGLSSGTYIVRLETPTGATVTRRVVKL